jgi:hypothetical protein
MKKTTFKEAVFQAFKDTKYPNGSILRRPDSYYYQRQARLFERTNWQELSLEDLGYASQEMFILSDEAFAYFLPAILIDIHGKNINSQDFVYSHLSPPVEINSQEFQKFDERMRFFTLEQSLVILRFIKFFVKTLIYNAFYEKMYRGKDTLKYWKGKVKKLRRQKGNP